jgi:uncharacterized protein YukE
MVKFEQELEAFKIERDSINNFINETKKRLLEIESRIRLPEEFEEFKIQFQTQSKIWKNKSQEMFDLYIQIKEKIETNSQKENSFAGTVDLLTQEIYQEIEERKKEDKKINEHF